MKNRYGGKVRRNRKKSRRMEGKGEGEKRREEIKTRMKGGEERRTKGTEKKQRKIRKEGT